MWKRLRQDEEGTVLILLAGMMTAILGLAALGTDAGRLFVERQRLSVVADAAALSAAQFLPEKPDTAFSTARSYLEKNNVDPAHASISLHENGREMSVGANRTVPMTFARVFGTQSVDVTGDARAVTENLSGYLGAAPLGVPRADWQLGQQVVLKMGANDDAASPGNYNALALGKSGASAYEHNLMYGYDQWLRVDEWVATETGNMAGPTVRAVKYRIDQDPYSTFESHNRQSARLVVVPILENFEINGKGEVHIIGFGMFYLEAAVDKGNDKGEITGRFLKFVAEGEGSLAAPDYGVRTTKLK